jgi:F0F1-type ATP synthase membrane subunit b/b'
MSLLLSLGVNATLAIQLGIFLTVFVVLKYVLFGPYFKAFNQRAESTVGQADLAEKFIAETKALEEEFASKAQVANERFRAIYDESRGQAVKEYENLVSGSRIKAKALVDEARTQVAREMETAKGQLAKEIPEVAKIINQKMIGKDAAL